MGKKHTWKDYGIKKSELDRTVAVKHVIDCNRKTDKNKEPKMVD